MDLRLESESFTARRLKAAKRMKEGYECVY